MVMYKYKSVFKKYFEDTVLFRILKYFEYFILFSKYFFLSILHINRRLNELIGPPYSNAADNAGL